MLIQIARAAWDQKDPDYCDDITVTVVILPCMPPSMGPLDLDAPTEPAKEPRRSILVRAALLGSFELTLSGV